MRKINEFVIRRKGLLSGRGLVEVMGSQSVGSFLSLKELERLGLITVETGEDVIKYKFLTRYKDFDREELLVNVSVVFELDKLAMKNNNHAFKDAMRTVRGWGGYVVNIDKSGCSVDTVRCLDGCTIIFGNKSKKIRNLIIQDTGDYYTMFLDFNRIKSFTVEFGELFWDVVIRYGLPRELRDVGQGIVGLADVTIEIWKGQRKFVDWFIYQFVK